MPFADLFITGPPVIREESFIHWGVFNKHTFFTTLLENLKLSYFTYIHTYVFSSIYPFTGNSSQGCRDSHNKYRHRMSVELHMS